MKSLFLFFVVLLTANFAVSAHRAIEVEGGATTANVFANQLTFTNGTTNVRHTLKGLKSGPQR